VSHSRAVAAMLLATLLWSMAGVVTRYLQSAGSFEATFWRSFFNAAALLALLAWLRGWRTLAATLRSGGATLWLSGACWSVMFTAFMVAITMTTVANVLVTMAIAPLVTALVARFALGHRLPARTWAAVLVAGAGIAWMYANEVAAADPRHLAGTAVALGVPIAAAINWTVIQKTGRGGTDLLPAVLIGAVGSCLVTLLPSVPFAATGQDLALLGLLGVAQLAIPCLIAVAAARYLSAPEAALLSLLEIVFGVTWTWLGAGEVPGRHVLVGGALVIGALVANEALALRRAG
jgi:drug/metabolite transporter (DMT)-like permease